MERAKKKKNKSESKSFLLRLIKCIICCYYLKEKKWINEYNTGIFEKTAESHKYDYYGLGNKFLFGRHVVIA